MDFEFFDARQVNQNRKATVHKNGRLGFNSGAADYMKLESKQCVKIAKSSDFDKTGNLYVVVEDEKSEIGFELSISGGYYYASTKHLFTTLGYDLKGKKYIYDISKVEEFDDEEIYFLKLRIIERTSNEEENENEE